MQDGVRKALDLKFVRVSVFSEPPFELPASLGITLHLAGFVEPGKKYPGLNTAVLAVYAEAFLEFASKRNRQFQMTQTAVGQVGFDEPAKGPRAVRASRADGQNLSGKQSR